MGGFCLRSASATRTVAVVLVTVAAVGAAGLAAASASPRRSLPPTGYGAGQGYCTSYSGGANSAFSFDNVYACKGSTTGTTTFDAPGAGVYAWQCVELSARFLWAVDGIWAGPGSGVQDGADLVSVVHGSHPQIAVGTPGPGSVPLPGDVISLGPGGGSDPTFGHTAVVISADAGTGQFEIMSENDPEDSAGEQSLQVDLGGGHNGHVLFNGAWTSASWLETGQFSPPPDGTFVQLQGTVEVYVMAGGAPLYVSNWSAVGGPHPVQVLTQAEWNTLRAVPANGTFLNADGPVYEVAGGAPMFVSNWANVGGAQPYVTIDPWDIANIANPAAHLRAVPANGTVIHDNQTQMVYVIAGGAPLYVSTWSAIGGPQPAVGIDGWDIANITNPAAHLRKRPGNGTFLRAGTHGAISRVAGGYPFRLSNCRAIGGCKHPVTIDPWDLAHLRSPRAHLLPVPRNGTIVRCYPSRRYWSFRYGKRHRAKASAKAVAVDDSSVLPFPVSKNVGRPMA